MVEKSENIEVKAKKKRHFVSRLAQGMVFAGIGAYIADRYSTHKLNKVHLVLERNVTLHPTAEFAEVESKSKVVIEGNNPKDLSEEIQSDEGLLKKIDHVRPYNNFVQEKVKDIPIQETPFETARKAIYETGSVAAFETTRERVEKEEAILRQRRLNRRKTAGGLAAVGITSAIVGAAGMYVVDKINSPGPVIDCDNGNWGAAIIELPINQPYSLKSLNGSDTSLELDQTEKLWVYTNDNNGNEVVYQAPTKIEVNNVTYEIDKVPNTSRVVEVFAICKDLSDGLSPSETVSPAPSQ
jgi:hypothetical protein